MMEHGNDHHQIFVVASERTAASNGNGETVTPSAVTENADRIAN